MRKTAQKPPSNVAFNCNLRCPCAGVEPGRGPRARGGPQQLRAGVRPRAVRRQRRPHGGVAAARPQGCGPRADAVGGGDVPRAVVQLQRRALQGSLEGAGGAGAGLVRRRRGRGAERPRAQLRAQPPRAQVGRGPVRAGAPGGGRRGQLRGAVRRELARAAAGVERLQRGLLRGRQAVHTQRHARQLGVAAHHVCGASRRDQPQLDVLRSRRQGRG
mmetsp:Transcript_35578/g.87509  ORF Transcript_35578/g.87509 Transcript_35578/m.87509 type:complete len:216 (+) Transcript_35578:817-1464(+)